MARESVRVRAISSRMAWKIGSTGGACARSIPSAPSAARVVRLAAAMAAGRRLAGYPLGRAQDIIPPHKAREL